MRKEKDFDLRRIQDDTRAGRRQWRYRSSLCGPMPISGGAGLRRSLLISR